MPGRLKKRPRRIVVGDNGREVVLLNGDFGCLQALRVSAVKFQFNGQPQRCGG